MPAPLPAEELRATSPTLRHAAEGALWAMALLLVVQTFLPWAAPTVLDALFSLWVQRRSSGSEPSYDVAIVGSLLPWIVFAAMHLLHARLLRQGGGSFRYSSGQIVLLALLPGYNLYGTVALFTAHGAELERRGAGRSVALELRAGSALASGLAVASMVCWLRLVRPVLTAPHADFTSMATPSRGVVVLVLWLLMLRLFVLARLQLALARALAAGPVAPAPATRVPWLPGAPAAAAVAALAAAAGVLAYRPPGVPRDAAAVDVHSPGGEPTIVDPFASKPGPKAKPTVTQAPGASEAQRPATPEPPRLPDGHLMGGRTLAEWRERLGALRARTDEDGKRLYALTRTRAERNGLQVTERPDGVEVQASPELIRRALQEVSR